MVTKFKQLLRLSCHLCWRLVWKWVFLCHKIRLHYHFSSAISHSLSGFELSLSLSPISAVDAQPTDGSLLAQSQNTRTEPCFINERCIGVLASPCHKHLVPVKTCCSPWMFSKVNQARLEVFEALSGSSLKLSE